jgi:hypothetical protein
MAGTRKKSRKAKQRRNRRVKRKTKVQRGGQTTTVIPLADRPVIQGLIADYKEPYRIDSVEPIPTTTVARTTTV